MGVKHMMVTIGRKIYYEKTTGVVLYDTGERVGENIVDSTVEEDFKYALELRNKDPENVGVLKLEPHQYNQEFAECVAYRVNPDTLEMEFGYRYGEQPSEYDEPFSKKIAQLAERSKAVEDALLQMMIEKGEVK